MNFAELLDHENRRDFSEDCVVALCEGKADASFLTLLAQDRGLTGIRVGFPDQETAGAFGKSAFGRYLSSLVTKPGFGRHVKAIAVFGDNDCATAFQDIANQFPTDVYAKPMALGVRAEQVDRVSSVVFLIPDDATGSLETLILRSNSWTEDKKQCVETFRECAVGACGWTQSHFDKFRLRCVVASTCTDPECSTTMLWKKTGHPFALSHAVFDGVAAALVETRSVLTV